MAKYTGAFPTKTIKKGSKGTNVTRWQNFLKWMGYSLKADSIFGSITREKTIACQKKLGFTGKAVDGIVGPKTIAKAKEKREAESIFKKVVTKITDTVEAADSVIKLIGWATTIYNMVVGMLP